MKPFSRRGPVTKLDEALIEQIIVHVPRVFYLKHVARLSKIAYSTMHEWMQRGEKELESESEEDEESIYVKFYNAYQIALSEALAEKLAVLSTCPKNYGAIVWILEHCYKQEFMSLPEDVQKILDWVNDHIKPMLAKGATVNGEEIKSLDQESDQASGCAS